MSKDYQEIHHEEESSEISKQSNYNLDTVKHCMDKISFITRIQNERAMKETQRNYKAEIVPSYSNTVGQAYYNLNKCYDTP